MLKKLWNFINPIAMWARLSETRPGSPAWEFVLVDFVTLAKGDTKMMSILEVLEANAIQNENMSTQFWILNFDKHLPRTCPKCANKLNQDELVPNPCGYSTPDPAIPVPVHVYDYRGVPRWDCPNDKCSYSNPPPLTICDGCQTEVSYNLPHNKAQDHLDSLSYALHQASEPYKMPTQSDLLSARMNPDMFWMPRKTMAPDPHTAKATPKIALMELIKIHGYVGAVQHAVKLAEVTYSLPMHLIADILREHFTYEKAAKRAIAENPELRLSEADRKTIVNFRNMAEQLNNTFAMKSPEDLNAFFYGKVNFVLEEKDIKRHMKSAIEHKCKLFVHVTPGEPIYVDSMRRDTDHKYVFILGENK